jgi:signal peptide peptidase SppA
MTTPTPRNTPYGRIWQAVLESPWAILPGKLATILDVLTLHTQGTTFTAEEIEHAIGAARSQPTQASRSGAVAVIPIRGTIAQRMSLLDESSGGTSTESVARQFRAALADPQVGSILLDVDSPGGSVYGVPELAAEIYGARGDKRLVAVANSLAASAAYWIASAADELVVTPSGEVGSIGVLSAHQDRSAALDTLGIKTTLISAGKYKVEGNPFEPLSDDARAAIQSRVDEYYADFVGAVARQRGVSTKDVRGGFGEGRTVGAHEAVRLGMADRVATLDDTIARLTGTTSARTGTATGTAALAEAPPWEAVSGLELRKRRLRLAGRA